MIAPGPRLLSVAALIVLPSLTLAGVSATWSASALAVAGLATLVAAVDAAFAARRLSRAEVHAPARVSLAQERRRR